MNKPNTEYLEKVSELLKLYVKPHKVKSRECTESDIPRILEDAVKMQDLCAVPIGRYPMAFAIAHQQIDDKDPLRFFVTFDGNVIINPKIVRHNTAGQLKSEGCMSFPYNDPANVMRYNKIEAEYVTIDEETLNSFTQVKKAKLNGRDSQIFQHEIGHFECDYIYPLDEIIAVVDNKDVTKT